MTTVIQPFHFLVIALAGALNRHQQAAIDYLIEENRVLKGQLEGKRLRFTDEQRIRLAVKAKVLDRLRFVINRTAYAYVSYPVYGELLLEPLRESDRGRGSESASGSFSILYSVWGGSSYFSRRITAE